MNCRSYTAGNILIGDHQAQRRRSAEQAQQEHRAQFAPPEAEIAPRQQAVGSQTQRRHPPAVGQDLERRITHAQQQQGEQRGQSECRRGESRPENAFDTQHKKLVWSRKNKKYIAIPHSPGVKSAAAKRFSPFPGRGSGIRRRDRPELSPPGRLSPGLPPPRNRRRPLFRRRPGNQRRIACPCGI